jgi:hypothetical protein
MLVLFALVSLGSGMDTTDVFAVVTMVSIFLGRQVSKYFDMKALLTDSGGKVTWVQNGLAMLLFIAAVVIEVTEADEIGIIDYLLIIAAVVQLILLISKRISRMKIARRSVFEESVASLYHFVVLGSLLSRTTQSKQLISIAAVIAADTACRAQRIYEEVAEFTPYSGRGVQRKWKLFATRVAGVAVSLTAAIVSVMLYEDDDIVGKYKTIATLGMVGAVLKAANLLAFILDSRKNPYKSVFSTINNGTTTLLLVASTILLGSDPDGAKFVTVLMFLTALGSRLVDMVQNAFESGMVNAKTLYISSMDMSSTKRPLDKAGFDNFRTWLVFLMLAGSAVYAYVGIDEVCKDFITEWDCEVALNHTYANGTIKELPGLTDRTQNEAMWYFLFTSLHAFLLIVAFIVSGCYYNADDVKLLENADFKLSAKILALSTTELVRILVSSAIIILGGYVLAVTSNESILISYTFYLLADGLGMSHA